MAAGFLLHGFWGTASSKESRRNGPAAMPGPAAVQPPSLTITNAELVGQDEVFHDPPAPSLLKPIAGTSGPRPNSVSRNSVKTSGLRIDTFAGEHSDWKAYPAPRELLEVGFETAPEIQNIIVSSIERVQERIGQEKHLRKKTETNKGKERMVIEPVVVVQGPAQSGDEPQVTSQSHMSNLSVATESSVDSGYVSGPVASGPPKRRLRAFDKLVGWASGNKEAFSISAIVRPSSGHAQSISIPLGTKSTSPQPSSPAGSAAASTRECVSCLDDFSPKEVVTLTCHSYCKSCLATLICTAMSSETYWPPRCCLTEIPVEVLLPHMDKQTRSAYKKIAEERSISAGERIYCHACSSWVPPKNIDMAIACAACQSCRKKTCTSCRDAYHSNGECPADPNMRATLRLAEELGWRRCFSCHAMVEHNTGCLHMTCKCKAQFCYVCGVKWRTCTCTDVALSTILATAQTRRLEAQQEEIASRRRAARTRTATSNISHADAADLPGILARIEEFETKEAVRKANEVEKLRLKAEARRQQRQEERIMSISKKYHNLRNELEFVHSAQELAITDRFNNERSRLHSETEILRESHMKELNALQISNRARIETLEISINSDFEQRKAREREIELGYLTQLREYWSGWPEQDLEIEKAMNPLKASHREAHLRWSARESAKTKDVMDAAIAHIDSMRRQQYRDMSLVSQDECRIDTERLGAEGWLSTIVHERKTMLGRLEDGDYAAVVHEAEAKTDEDVQSDRGPQLMQLLTGPSCGSSVERSAVANAGSSASAGGSRQRTGSASASSSLMTWTELASRMARSGSLSAASLGPLAEEQAVRLGESVAI